jgi:hypothetical protein
MLLLCLELEKLSSGAQTGDEKENKNGKDNQVLFNIYTQPTSI